jgi:hypothetical protein
LEQRKNEIIGAKKENGEKKEKDNWSKERERTEKRKRKRIVEMI